jgi:cytochrome c oxidase cbb3-type subunit 1
MMAMTSLMLGFGVLTLTGGIYYVMPRLTGTNLANIAMARLGLFGTTGLAALAILSIPLGFGDGSQPFGVAWWLDIPIALVLAIPAMVVLSTVANRTEKRSYVTIWFVVAGVVWLPLLYVATTVAGLPFMSSLTQTLGSLFFSAGFVTMWLVAVGSGLFYYTIVKELDVPLASRQLALVGLWSLGFAAAWWGSAQIIFGPGPDWLEGVAAALGLAFPIGAIANASNFSLTLEDSWGTISETPGLISGVIGAYLTVVVAILASLAAFPSIGAVVALTTFWEGIEYVALLGIGPLLAAGIVFPALPRLVGRAVPKPAMVSRFNRMTVIGVGGVLVSLVAAGLYRGYSWIGGSNGDAYVDVGQGWSQGAGAVDAIVLIAVLFGIVSLIGQLAYAGVVFGTVTTGNVVPQEILVTKGSEDE